MPRRVVVSSDDEDDVVVEDASPPPVRKRQRPAEPLSEDDEHPTQPARSSDNYERPMQPTPQPLKRALDANDQGEARGEPVRRLSDAATGAKAGWADDALGTGTDAFSSTAAAPLATMDSAAVEIEAVDVGVVRGECLNTVMPRAAAVDA